MSSSDNRWLNTADIKNWYIENYPHSNLTEKQFSIMDIFHDIGRIPGTKMVFKRTFVLESEEDEG